LSELAQKRGKMYIITIDDGFCVWSFEMDGDGGYSIQDLIDVIAKNTKLVVKLRQQIVEPTVPGTGKTLTELGIDKGEIPF
jgi:hypothetical protein